MKIKPELKHPGWRNARVRKYVSELMNQLIETERKVIRLEKDVAYWEKHHNALQRAMNSRIQNQP